MNNLPKNIDELAVAATAEVDDEPTRLTVTRLAVAALIGAHARNAAGVHGRAMDRMER
ncbi:hypothetical protein [Mycetocola miduiensis]|uniref:Uncharacterized protein n=1 Tax=Mycetocola miduiensis TaxID=995034 RepID=A0A1I4ZG47_9MICO|nr:hypothetical protein [Mycetocola miduiensis]SFN49023.1 hypothetical protein SAMN05216219_0776 [Mycetocola miduiensis]